MKVTISFNGTKIVVPCADGEISVREVTSLAATRYKKAIGKTNSYWVSVASLKSHEGGILDADDLIGMYLEREKNRYLIPMYILILNGTYIRTYILFSNAP